MKNNNDKAESQTEEILSKAQDYNVFSIDYPEKMEVFSLIKNFDSNFTAICDNAIDFSSKFDQLLQRQNCSDIKYFFLAMKDKINNYFGVQVNSLTDVFSKQKNNIKRAVDYLENSSDIINKLINYSDGLNYSRFKALDDLVEKREKILEFNDNLSNDIDKKHDKVMESLSDKKFLKEYVSHSRELIKQRNETKILGIESSILNINSSVSVLKEMQSHLVLSEVFLEIFYRQSLELYHFLEDAEPFISYFINNNSLITELTNYQSSISKFVNNSFGMLRDDANRSARMVSSAENIRTTMKNLKDGYARELSYLSNSVDVHKKKIKNGIEGLL